MSELPRAQSIADLPPQRASAPATPAEARARYFNTGNAFDVQLPEVPDHSFVDEPARALAPETPTSLLSCDLAARLGCAFPATSPFLLAHYGRVRSGERLDTDFVASGVVAYVIRGCGKLRCQEEALDWGAGDVMVLPGGVRQTWEADEDAVLWLVTNEPQLAFEHLRAPEPGRAPTPVVHYPAQEIARQIELVYAVGRGEDIAGSALIFSSDEQEASRNALPTLTVAMNSLPPGVVQRPHRHNSVAVSLVIQGQGCFSRIDGRRKEWSPWATTITPPTSVHSHHNAGDEQAMFLIIQDGGLFYHARAMGFEFTDE